MLQVDWTINLGTIIPIVTLLGIIAYRITKMETKVDLMWVHFTQNFERRKSIE